MNTTAQNADWIAKYVSTSCRVAFPNFGFLDFFQCNTNKPNQPNLVPIGRDQRPESV